MRVISRTPGRARQCPDSALNLPYTCAMGRANRAGVLAAQLNGVAAAYAQVRRLTYPEALAEVAKILASARIRPGTREAVDLLTRAAVPYVDSEGESDRCYPAMAAFLGDAGADLAKAQQIKASQPRTTGQVTG